MPKEESKEKTWFSLEEKRGRNVGGPHDQLGLLDGK